MKPENIVITSQARKRWKKHFGGGKMRPQVIAEILEEFEKARPRYRVSRKNNLKSLLNHRCQKTYYYATKNCVFVLVKNYILTTVYKNENPERWTKKKPSWMKEAE